MAESQKESESLFTKSDNFLDGLVRIAEKVIVLIIAIVIFGAVILQSIWILRACQEYRFSYAVTLLSRNWEALLILLIPLFYRPIRTFMDRVEEFWKIKAAPSGQVQEPKQSEPEKPTELQDGESE